jgi:CRISPR-associated protein Cmr3
MQTLFLQALDVLVLRANKLFEGPGSQGEALMPPWPSVVAGALRSRMLADAGVDMAAFAAGHINHPVLGSPQQPGPFAVLDFTLALLHPQGRVECLRPLPADGVVMGQADEQALSVHTLKPQPVGWGLHSAAFPQVPLLVGAGRGKPLGGYWLRETGWQAYQAGRVPQAQDLVRTSELWKTETRTGIAMGSDTGTAADGQLFTTRVIHPSLGLNGQTLQVGFAVQVQGQGIPTEGLLRLGGDGRAVSISPVPAPPQPDYEAMVRAGRVRLVLSTPGMFPLGDLPCGAQPHSQATQKGLPFGLHGVKGHLVSACVPRAEVVSGWNLALQQPKTAQRAAPVGSVYWLELDATTTAQDLHKLVTLGLWPENADDEGRRSEGFNRVCLAQYPLR